MNGTDLLAEFRKSRSDKAFGELVRRYTNLVFSAARRRLGNEAAAEDATQSVFIRLASTAPELRDDAALVAWLHRTTVHVSIDLWRVENRRRVREEHAAAMQTNADDAVWKEIAPVVDEALNQLTDAERQVILLRFFEHHSMRELGAAFGISEDAAKMRVSRALERLRERVAVKGAACGAAALGALLTERAIVAAPASLVAALLCVSWPVPVAVSAGTSFGMMLLNIWRTRLGLAAAGTVLIATGAFFATRPHHGHLALTVSPSPDTRDPRAARPSPATPTEQETGTVAENDPDPVELLRAVARARERIQSGTLELDVQVTHFFIGETNYKHIVAVFDAPKARFDSVAREYAYTSVGSDESEKKIREQGLDREAAVKAGLLKGFEAHVVSIYDGAALLQYRESDGRPQTAEINDARRGTAEFLTNPQCFGLRVSLFIESTVRSCLAYEEAKSVKLMGKESVEGKPAWRVQVLSKHDELLDFWIDAARPERLLKQAHGQNVVLSRYDRSGGPIPAEVIAKDHRDGKPRTEIRYLLSAVEFNLAVPASTWTLAGLGMKVGTSVIDARSRRGIGFWTGAGLSDDLPRRGSEPEPAPDLADLLPLLDDVSASAQAFEAAQWILFNTPDGPEVEKAARVIEREHLRNTNVVALCKRLESARYRCSTNLLESFLARNPSAEVRANACFLLATMKKEQARFGQDKKATAEAMKLFERVVNEFGKAREAYAIDLAGKAKTELDELRRLLVGMPAPDAEGVGFDGERIRLRDYQGKIVVLVFWCCGYSDALEHAQFVQRMEGQPVAFIGVSCDEDLKRAREGFAKYDITWPNIWDKRDGPIARAWNVQSWPNVWVIDGRGIIRFRGVRGPELVKAVEALLAE